MDDNKEPVRVRTDSESSEYFWATLLLYIFAISPALIGTYSGLEALHVINILKWLAVFIVGIGITALLYRLYHNDKHWYALGLVISQWVIYSLFVPDNPVANTIKSIYEWGIS